MWVQKIKHFDIVCPHCGAKITLPFDEYQKYVKDTEGYAGFTITCQRKDENDKNRDIEYVNMDCPVCNGYIPLTVSDTCDSCDADIWGFVCSEHCKPYYGSIEEVKIEDYLESQFSTEDDEAL